MTEARKGQGGHYNFLKNRRAIILYLFQIWSPHQPDV
jgi:hypothetical protein